MTSDEALTKTIAGLENEIVELDKQLQPYFTWDEIRQRDLARLEWQMEVAAIDREKRRIAERFKFRHRIEEFGQEKFGMSAPTFYLAVQTFFCALLLAIGKTAVSGFFFDARFFIGVSAVMACVSIILWLASVALTQLLSHEERDSKKRRVRVLQDVRDSYVRRLKYEKAKAGGKNGHSRLI